tara:strand:+ start:1643 stop:1852 length:210 start_codon:yes stop_codon:yes gene_type:complete
MREFEIEGLKVSIDSDGYVKSVIEDGEEILDTLPDSKVFDLIGLAEQEARDQYEEDRAEACFDDCYHGA